jgi:hypothetical protein
MALRSLTRGVPGALLFLIAGCHLPREVGPTQSLTPLQTPSWLANTLRPPSVEVTVAQTAAPPPVPSPSLAPAVPLPLPTAKAATALTSTTPPAPTNTKEDAKASAAPIPPPDNLDQQWVAAGMLRAVGSGTPKLRPPVLIREQEPPIALPKDLPSITEPPGTLYTRPASGLAEPPTARVSPGEFLPPIPVLPDAPLPSPVKPKSLVPPPPAPRTSDTPPAISAPATLPPLATAPSMPDTGPIELNGNPVPYDSLSKLVDGNICSNCGNALGIGGCPTCGGCGDPPCRAGGCRAEPFPAHTAAGRLIGLIYSCVCCPDPCYQPKWEPLADAAFFVDAVRPKTSTRFRWDYGAHVTFPDRGEIFFARGDGKGRGPKANAPLLGIPHVDYHELMLITEAATGAAGVQIAVPYRSVNSTPFGQDGAGFADMNITAKTMLFDSELFLFGFQMRTYIPIGQTAKGLGTGHVSLEPGLNFGLRLAPKTYLQSQVLEWIPLGGDKD